MPKLKGCTDRDLKERVRHMYSFIRLVYRRLSAFGLKGKVFGIRWNVFRDFVADTIKFTDR